MYVIIISPWIFTNLLLIILLCFVIAIRLIPACRIKMKQTHKMCYDDRYGYNAIVVFGFYVIILNIIVDPNNLFCKINIRPKLILQHDYG